MALMRCTYKVASCTYKVIWYTYKVASCTYKVIWCTNKDIWLGCIKVRAHGGCYLFRTHNVVDFLKSLKQERKYDFLYLYMVL